MNEGLWSASQMQTESDMNDSQCSSIQLRW